MKADWIAPKRTALLVIDCQVDFGAPEGEMARRAIQRQPDWQQRRRPGGIHLQANSLARLPPCRLRRQLDSSRRPASCGIRLQPE